jgi:hypothetical protein
VGLQLAYDLWQAEQRAAISRSRVSPPRRPLRRADAKASQVGDAVTEARVTVREVVRLLLEADPYPRLGNEDWPVAARMEGEALEKAATAVASLDDPPEFAVWLEALRRRELSTEEREEIYWAIHDYFAGEEVQLFGDRAGRLLGA